MKTLPDTSVVKYTEEYMESNSLWFISDTHFGHSSVNLFYNRGFLSTEVMDESMIANWNSVVMADDHVYFLGDFSFHKSLDTTADILNRLNGHIHFVLGNHDCSKKRSMMSILQDADNVVSVDDICTIKVYDFETEGWQEIVLCHYPMAVWNRSHFGSWHLHGHTHGGMEDNYDIPRYDVGVDLNFFTPIGYVDIASVLSDRGIPPMK